MATAEDDEQLALLARHVARVGSVAHRWRSNVNVKTYQKFSSERAMRQQPHAHMQALAPGALAQSDWRERR